MRRSLVNGVKTEFVDVSNRGLQYGDGLFETILYSEGKLQFWDQHILRMLKGAEKLHIEFPGEACFLDDIEKLVDHTRTQNAIIKLILTRGSSERGYVVPHRPIPLRMTLINAVEEKKEWRDGIHVTVCSQTVSVNRGLAGIKHLNRLENVIARNEWRDEYHEGIMLDDDGNVIEGTMSNLFLVKNNELYTPDLSRCGVMGVIRENILSIAKDENIIINIGDVTLDNLINADEVFFTNSIIGIWPAIKIDTKIDTKMDTKMDTIDYAIGDICLLLQKKLDLYRRKNAKVIN